MKTVSITLPDELAAKLASAAKKQGTSRSAVAQEALRSFLGNGRKSAQRPRRATAYELAPDLAGCLDGGPGDLAHNPKHMEGYGR